MKAYLKAEHALGWKLNCVSTRQWASDFKQCYKKCTICQRRFETPLGEWASADFHPWCYLFSGFNRFEVDARLEKHWLITMTK